MGNHWRPGGRIVRIAPVRDGPWTRAEAYAPKRSRGGALTLLLGAVFAGLVGGLAWQQRPSPPTASADGSPVAPASTIEWNAVQAVPRRALDEADLAWERRATGGDTASGSSGPAAAAVRASFGFCHNGGGTNCVVDGDTFYVNGEKVRIAGIDAPETHPPRCAEEARLGNAATERLRTLLNSGAVTMTSIDRDRDSYGRLLRNVSVNGADVGEAMVSAGVAREWVGRREPWC
jgi:endonuclease YncB( thermonuclease family)